MSSIIHRNLSRKRGGGTSFVGGTRKVEPQRGGDEKEEVSDNSSVHSDQFSSDFIDETKLIQHGGKGSGNDMNTLLQIFFDSDNMLRACEKQYDELKHACDTCAEIAKFENNDFCVLRLHNFLRLTFDRLGGKGFEISDELIEKTIQDINPKNEFLVSFTKNKHISKADVENAVEGLITQAVLSKAAAETAKTAADAAAAADAADAAAADAAAATYAADAAAAELALNYFICDNYGPSNIVSNIPSVLEKVKNFMEYVKIFNENRKLELIEHLVHLHVDLISNTFTFNNQTIDISSNDFSSELFHNVVDPNRKIEKSFEQFCSINKTVTITKSEKFKKNTNEKLTLIQQTINNSGLIIPLVEYCVENIQDYIQYVNKEE